MANDLIVAAYNGDFDKASQLLSNPNTNIEEPIYSNLFTANGTKVWVNALMLAIKKNHASIVDLLVEKGISLDWRVKQDGQSKYDLFKYPSPLFYAGICKVNNLDIFKKLLRHSNTLDDYGLYDPDLPYSKTINTIELIDRNYSTGLPNDFRAQLLKLFLHEAVLKSSHKIIKQIVKTCREATVDSASMENYLKDESLTYDQLITAKDGVDYLAKQSAITPLEAKNLKESLAVACPFWELPAFSPLQKAFLMQAPTRSLKELFAELQYWLYPEKKLPPIPFDSITYSRIDQTPYNTSPDQISYWQDPVRLRTFLNLNQTEMLGDLLAVNSTIDCPAALLLAVILLYKSDEKILVLNREEPLLTEEQKQLGLQVLTTYYALTALEKSLLMMHHEQNLQITQLAEKNKTMTDKVDLLIAEVKRLNTLVMPKENNKQNASPPERTFKLF